MKRITVWMLVLAVAGLGGTVWPGQEKSEATLRLELHLADGSRIIGTPAIESVPVQTSYAKMNVPLKQIVKIRIDENHETASIDLQNGDKLKGVVTLAPISLETLIGKIAVGAEHIREIRCMSGDGPLPPGLSRGLVLYYPFDKDEGEKVADGSGHGADGYWVGTPTYEAGVKGKAARFRSKDTYIVSSSQQLNMNGWKEAAVCLWVRAEEHTTYGYIIGRGSLSREQAGAFWLQTGQQYGRGLVGFLGSSTQPAADYKSTDPTMATKKWFHLAMTYDGTAMRYYIDGQLEKEVSARERDTPIWDCPDSKLVIGNASRLPLVDWADMFLNGSVDEVCIFNRALRGEEVKQVYDAQNPKEGR